ncbi:MAG: hypothetical protein GY816_22785, partial [Cytophagales bacterium]|nr:hypothetical protein [Cytophagales bacterium]
TLPDGVIIESFEKFLRPLREDTLTHTIFNMIGQEVVGTNTLEIFLDPANAADELDEGNNISTISIEIFQGNTAHLYPPDFSMYTTSDISFYWQPTNIFEPSRSYELQIDTVSSFDSPLFRSLAETGDKLLNRTVDFSTDNLPDTTVVYWRTRFGSPMNTQEEEWEQTSFTIVNAGEEGWGQFESDQVELESLVGVEFANGGEQWEFTTTDSPLNIRTFGANYPGFSYSDLEVLASGIDYLVTSNTIDPECTQNTINALVFDKESTNPYRPIAINGADVFSPLVCGRLPQMVYNMTETDVIGADAYLETLIGNMATGDHILLFTIGQVIFSNWDADVLNSLQLVGVNSGDITVLSNGQPLIILGRKEEASHGTANLISSDGTPTPVTEQSIQMVDNVNGSFTSGSVTTGRIGPAKSWNEFTYQINENPEDGFNVSLVGIKPDGSEIDLFSFARTDIQDLTSIDAGQFPWLKAKFSFRDNTNLTPPQFDFWQVTYEPPPEGLLYSNDKETDVIFEGQPAEKEFAFYNLSQVDFADSLDVNAILIGRSNGSLSTQTFKIKGPLAGDTTRFATGVSSVNQDGLNNLSIKALANENELQTFNNELILQDAMDVQADNTNPVLDVTFDGAYIMNGDIVSPDPTILIRMRDDNSYLTKSDTVGMVIQLKLPCEGCTFERVNFSDPTLSYGVAGSDFEITYTPGSLVDGMHTLSVQGRDESGNAAGVVPYEVEFEVVTESSITHFYPYPNPFSTQTRFVFTLTGSIIPEKLKIQIMTISGRIVRELNQDEIGPIKIGNNITEFAWDGTDEFGEQLANGVYFYRVMMESGDQKFERRTTSADGAFKNGFGKLYILR